MRELLTESLTWQPWNIKPLTDTKQHHLWFTFIQIKIVYILFFIFTPHFTF